MSVASYGITIIVSLVVGGFAEHFLHSTEAVVIEGKVRAAVAADVAKIVGDIKKWEAEITTDTKAVIAQFEARLKQIL